MTRFLYEAPSMKVILVGTGRRPIPPIGYGAIERILGEYATALQATGTEVEILNQYRADRYTKGWAFERRLPLLLRHRHADIIHVNTSRAALALALAGIPYVFSTYTPRWLDPGGSNFLQRTLFEREHFAVRFAEATIVMSEALRRVVSGVRGRRGPVVYIPIGIDTEKFKAKTEGIAHRALGVGVIDRRKRWHLAAQAVRGTGIFLTVAGPLVQLDYAAQLRAAGVELQGNLEDDRLLPEFDHASIVFHPSRTEVGMAQAPLQALAFGRAVLGGPAIQGMPGTITCPSDDENAMVEFLHRWAVDLDASPELRRDRGAIARAAVETHYAWSVVAPAHIDLYRDVIARRR